MIGWGPKVEFQNNDRPVPWAVFLLHLRASVDTTSGSHLHRRHGDRQTFFIVFTVKRKKKLLWTYCMEWTNEGDIAKNWYGTYHCVVSLFFPLGISIRVLKIINFQQNSSIFFSDKVNFFVKYIVKFWHFESDRVHKSRNWPNFMSNIKILCQT